MTESSTEQTHRPELDISRVAADSGSLRELQQISNPRAPGFTVVVQRSVLQAVHAHGKTDTSVEICGVLVGDIYHDQISSYLLIESHVPGDKATSRQTQVTFTAETWDGIQKVMEAKYPDKKIVGWYHTHPGFGVFLSGMDLFIQDHFFNLPWQAAWVYDPIAGTDGMFVWREGRSERCGFLIEENSPDPSSGADSQVMNSEPEDAKHKEQIRRATSRLWIVCAITLFMGGFLASWYLLLWLTDHGFRVRLPIE